MGTVNGGQRINQDFNNYNKSLAKWQLQESKLRKQFILNAWLRLSAFLSAFSLPFIVFEHWTVSFFICFTVCFAVFLWLVWRANKISNQRNYVGHRIVLLQKELKCLNGNWVDELDGSEFIEPDHNYAHDLDLFGKGSLFQFINRTSTRGGLLQLVYKLKNLSLSAEDIKQKQEGINELSTLTEFRQHFYALGAQVAEGNKRNRKLDLAQLPDLSFITKSVKVVMFVFLPVVALSIVLVSMGLASGQLLGVLFFIGLALVGARLKQINKVHSEVASLGNYLQRYSALIKHVEQTPLNAEYLIALKGKLKVDGKAASEVMSELAGHIKRFDQRLNMLLGVVLNGFLLWDLIVCLQLNTWYKKYGKELVNWLDALHEIEAMNSLATFAYNNPDFNYPHVSDAEIFTAINLGHPLIPLGERVNNDFQLGIKDRICVVTGANMAGKSTFLRTVGVALVLAGNGCVVAADSLHYKPMPFITNMRAIDNLLKHESYFFAELSRLQMILERLKSEGELFFILDEILKGTNSLDKYQGSMALIKQLLKFNGCGLVATHDLELGQLEKQTNGQVFNNCFEVNFKDEGLSFDYKLRTGVTESHNATYLMAKMGLITSENIRK
ncbi:MutS-related protein [Carboxylicivirga marina]|uniref:MutS-related protein n=1 Tax=Carboxylicivirga marina TaxID=2800988 RepID=UPI002592DBCA|nr:hypothetical protein [uncultured Carboxylicivirga sp.]